MATETLSMWRLHQLVVGVLENIRDECGVPRSTLATPANSHRAHTLWFHPMLRLIAKIWPLLLSMLTLICSSPSIIKPLLLVTLLMFQLLHHTTYISGTETDAARGALVVHFPQVTISCETQDLSHNVPCFASWLS